MMNSEIQKGLESLFDEAMALKFGKKVYEPTFKEMYEKHKGLNASIVEVYEKADDQAVVIEEIAGIIPGILEGRLALENSKRKKEAVQLDCNTAMVTYVVPLLGYSRYEGCDLIIDRMIEKWNAISTMKIQKAYFEDIQGGFKSRFCYITTAVCESLNKGDDCYELTTLRDYRDNYLSSQKEGSALVKEYYDVAPTIVKRISRLDGSAKVYSEIWETYLSPCIRLIEEDQKEACQELYTEMVKDLENRYIFS